MSFALAVVVLVVSVWPDRHLPEDPAVEAPAGAPRADDETLAADPPSDPASPGAREESDEPEATEAVAPPPDGFPQRTDTVLLFDDGTEGALAVDLDTWERTRVDLPGQRAGDQPFRLWQMGGWVVVGWQEIWAVAPGQPESARQLGQATVFLPHAEPDALWLIDYEGGRVGTGASTWTLIDPSGNDIAAVSSAPAGLLPVRGVPGGLVVSSPGGTLLIYDLEQDRLVANPIGESARLGDVTRDRVVWCDDDPCEQLLVTDAEGSDLAALGAGETFEPSQVWLSPDGDRIAAGVRVRVGDGVDFRLRVYRIEDGELLAETRSELSLLFGGWTLDGRQFFSWSHVPNATSSPAVLRRWSGGEDFEEVAVGEHGIRDVFGFVAFPSTARDGVYPDP